MSNRPVLSMNFYQVDNSSKNSLLIFNPYEQIRKQAKQQNQTKLKRIQSKKKNATKVIKTLTNKVNLFFPQQKKQILNTNRSNNVNNLNSFSQLSIISKKNTNKYNPQYFQSLHKNLKDINQLIDQLDIDS